MEYRPTLPSAIPLAAALLKLPRSDDTSAVKLLFGFGQRLRRLYRTVPPNYTPVAGDSIRQSAICAQVALTIEKSAFRDVHLSPPRIAVALETLATEMAPKTVAYVSNDVLLKHTTARRSFCPGPSH